jgi:type II secretory pathway component PulC
MAAAPGADMAVGAIIGGRERVAIIRQREKVFVVGIGDTVGGAVVTDIKDDKVIMRSGGRTFELAFGGEAP